MAPIVTLVLLKVDGQNLVAILMCFFQKGHYFSNSGLLPCHNDVIMGTMEGFVSLLFFKVERQNFVNWGILMCILENYPFSKCKASMTSS